MQAREKQTGARKRARLLTEDCSPLAAKPYEAVLWPFLIKFRIRDERGSVVHLVRQPSRLGSILLLLGRVDSFAVSNAVLTYVNLTITFLGLAA